MADAPENALTIRVDADFSDAQTEGERFQENLSREVEMAPRIREIPQQEMAGGVAPGRIEGPAEGLPAGQETEREPIQEAARALLGSSDELDDAAKALLEAGERQSEVRRARAVARPAPPAPAGPGAPTGAGGQIFGGVLSFGAAASPILRLVKSFAALLGVSIGVREAFKLIQDDARTFSSGFQSSISELAAFSPDLLAARIELEMAKLRQSMAVAGQAGADMAQTLRGRAEALMTEEAIERRATQALRRATAADLFTTLNESLAGLAVSINRLIVSINRSMAGILSGDEDQGFQGLIGGPVLLQLPGMILSRLVFGADREEAPGPGPRRTEPDLPEPTKEQQLVPRETREQSRRESSQEITVLPPDVETPDLFPKGPERQMATETTLSALLEEIRRMRSESARSARSQEDRQREIASRNPVDEIFEQMKREAGFA